MVLNDVTFLAVKTICSEKPDVLNLYPKTFIRIVPLISSSVIFAFKLMNLSFNLIELFTTANGS